MWLTYFLPFLVHETDNIKQLMDHRIINYYVEHDYVV